MSKMMRNDGNTAPRQFIANEYANVSREDAGTTLCHGDEVDELLVGNPFMFFNYFALDDRNHGVASAQGEGANFEEGFESCPIE